MDVNATQSLALAVGVGAGVTALSARLRIPSVLPLLVVGVLLGSSGLGLVDGESLGSALSALIAVSIGLLIFEGGLHLDSRELSRAPAAVRGLLGRCVRRLRRVTMAGRQAVPWGLPRCRCSSSRGMISTKLQGRWR